MYRATDSRTRRKIGGALGAAVVLAALALQPKAADAAHGGSGGGGFHGGGGGFHGGGGGFHGGGGEFHGKFNEFHGGGFHGGFHPGFRGGVAIGLGGFYAPYVWDYDYPYYDYYGYYPDYGYFGYSQPYAGQVWYYCSDPAGYYPYVTQCNAGWQTVPAS